VKDPHFRSFAFHVTAELATLDATLATKVLRVVAGQATDDGRKAPGPKDSAAFCDAFVLGGGLEHLDLSNEIQATIPPFLRLIIGAGFEDGSKSRNHTSVEVQRGVVRWLLQSNLWGRIQAAQQTQVIEALRNWPANELDALRTGFPSLPFDVPSSRVVIPGRMTESDTPTSAPHETTAVLADGSADVTSKPPSPSPRVETEKESSMIETQPPSDTAEPSPKPNAPSGPHMAAVPVPKTPASFHALLSELKRLWDESEAERADKQRRLREFDSELRRLRRELEEAQKDGSGWRAKFHEEQDKAIILRGDLEQSKGELATVREKSEKLRAELEAEKQAHGADAKRLLETVEIEKRREVDAFRNRLAGALRAEYTNFESVRGAPMDADLGEGLRSLLERLFELLKKQDIKL
jgi:hypothetical protein